MTGRAMDMESFHSWMFERGTLLTIEPGITILTLETRPRGELRLDPKALSLIFVSSAASLFNIYIQFSN